IRVVLPSPVVDQRSFGQRWSPIRTGTGPRNWPITTWPQHGVAPPQGHNEQVPRQRHPDHAALAKGKKTRGRSTTSSPSSTSTGRPIAGLKQPPKERRFPGSSARDDDLSGSVGVHNFLENPAEFRLESGIICRDSRVSSVCGQYRASKDGPEPRRSRWG